MPVGSNIFTAAVIAPFVTMLSAMVLATLQRGVEWVSSIAKNPQKGYLRQMRPYMKHLDSFIERILGGNKFTVSATNILLMTIAVLLLVLILEHAEQPKRVVRVVNKKDAASKEE